MNSNSFKPRSPAAAGRRSSWTRVVSLACVLSVAASAAAQSRRGGRRVVADHGFETVWVIDRAMPEHVVWQSMVRVTGGEGFRPVVLHGGEDERWSDSLGHLLELLPDGESIWVTDRGTLFNVDRVTKPDGLAATGSGPPVYSVDAGLDDLAALIAMRVDGELVVEPPVGAGPTIFVGVDAAIVPSSADVYLGSRDEALAYANQLAPRQVVVVVREGGMIPEQVLYTFQRGAKILEVDPPPYDIYDGWSEVQAVGEVRRQIRSSLPDLVVGMPEALVIAGDWHEIPFRYPVDVWTVAAFSETKGCAGCDNGRFEAAADHAYANLDNDPWGLPDVPVGRLMSPDRDLLAMQSVIGIWHDEGGFRPWGDGLYVGLLGTGPSYRREPFETWRDAFSDRDWSIMGPEFLTPTFRLDQEAFYAAADRSEIVLVHGHGRPNFVSPSGRVSNQSVSGSDLVQRRRDGIPAFWFLHACGTGKPDGPDGAADETLIVGLQSRLALGSLVAAEDLAAGSADPYWWRSVVEPGLSVGELVRRFTVAGAVAYRDGLEAAPGLPATTGSEKNRHSNALAVLYWVGDPLTRVGTAR